MRIVASFLVFFGVLAGVAGCRGQASDAEASRQPAQSPRASGAPTTTAPDAPAAGARATGARVPRIIFLGDSLTAGLGLDVDDSFPSQVQRRLDREGYGFEVVNAGVSGDTSAGGLRRLAWAMGEGDPRILVVALGGNDGLRGLAPEQLEQNLASIIEQAQARGLTVILAGMEAPPNFGADYTARFRGVYPALAARYKVRLVPFLLDGVAGNPALNQSDGIHPNARGAEVVADLVWPALEPALAAARSATSR